MIQFRFYLKFIAVWDLRLWWIAIWKKNEGKTTAKLWSFCSFEL